jgi:hypothetical protein
MLRGVGLFIFRKRAFYYSKFDVIHPASCIARMHTAVPGYNPNKNSATQRRVLKKSYYCAGAAILKLCSHPYWIINSLAEFSNRVELLVHLWRPKIHSAPPQRFRRGEKKWSYVQGK